jgi:hypothetical protein
VVAGFLAGFLKPWFPRLGEDGLFLCGGGLLVVIATIVFQAIVGIVQEGRDR